MKTTDKNQQFMEELFMEELMKEVFLNQYGLNSGRSTMKLSI